MIVQTNFFTLLQGTLIALKVLGVLTWSWWLILLPIELEFLMYFILFLILIMFQGIRR